MSRSNEWFQEHLTPNGWVSGSYRYDGSNEVEKDPPEDRVLTLCFHEEQSSVFSKMYRTYEEEWRTKNAEELGILLEKYGEMPEVYLNRKYLKR